MKRAPFSRLHPAARLGLLLAALVTLTTFNDPAFVAPLALAVTAAAVLACRAGHAVAKTLPLIVVFVVLSVVMWPPFVKTGTTRFAVAFYAATDVGLRYGLAVGLRAVAMLVAGLGFLAATTPEEFGEGLGAFRLPPPATVTFTLAFRLLPVMFENTQRAMEAQKARGMDFGRGFFAQARHVLPLVVPVFLYSLRSVDQLATALELRGYGARRRPASWPPWRTSAWDWVLPFASAAVAAAALALRILGFGAALPGRI